MSQFSNCATELCKRIQHAGFGSPSACCHQTISLNPKGLLVGHYPFQPTSDKTAGIKFGSRAHICSVTKRGSEQANSSYQMFLMVIKKLENNSTLQRCLSACLLHKISTCPNYFWKKRFLELFAKGTNTLSAPSFFYNIFTHLFPILWFLFFPLVFTTCHLHSQISREATARVVCCSKHAALPV